jgi:hypothetical protein
VSAALRRDRELGDSLVEYLEGAQEHDAERAAIQLDASAEELPRANGKLNGHARTATPGAAQPRRLSGTDFGDMEPHLADGYLVKGLLSSNSLAAIIGVTGCGKTFFATELAVHIAAGRAWRGHRVHGGLVAYAALEGPASAENRFVAAGRRHELAATLPLRLTPGPVNLRDAVDVALLIAFVRDAETAFQCKCAAVFIDTLSRALAGGEENNSEDMGALIVGADAVRLATGATVILVHHLGKDEGRGARGHSSLKAALDTEIEITNKDGLRIATATKQRDLPGGTRYAFRLEVVELGRDSDGDQVTSCTVAHEENAPAADRRQPTGKNQTALVTALQEWKRQHPDSEIVSTLELREIAKAQGVNLKRLPEVIEGLVRAEWLQPSVGGHKLLPEGTAP